MNSHIKTPTIEIDGHQWIQRAGQPCGDYETLTSYLGKASTESTINFVARHNLTRLKHGKLTIVPKPRLMPPPAQLHKPAPHESTPPRRPGREVIQTRPISIRGHPGAVFEGRRIKP